MTHTLFESILHELDLLGEGIHPAGPFSLGVITTLGGILKNSVLTEEERIAADRALKSAYVRYDPSYVPESPPPEETMPKPQKPNPFHERLGIGKKWNE